MATPSNANKLTTDDITILTSALDLAIQSAIRMQNGKTTPNEVAKAYEARERTLSALRVKLQQGALEL